MAQAHVARGEYASAAALLSRARRRRRSSRACRARLRPRERGETDAESPFALPEETPHSPSGP
jgi:hypothetical protein